MKRIVVCIAVAAALLAASAALAAPAGPAQASASKTVRIVSFEFLPASLRVSKGTRVVFSNASGTAHTATDRGVFDTGRIKGGRSVAVRFGQKGTFSYHCKIHPFMRGKVIVG